MLVHMLNFTVPHPTLSRAGLEPSETSLLEFQALLAERTGVPAAAQELLAGFPPRPVQVRALL